MAGTIPVGGDPFAKVERKNLIDEHIFGRIERDRIPHAPISTDSEFVRRAYVDATGQLPSLENVAEFLANPDPLKRDKLIDSLIGTEEFGEQWAWFWGDLFRTVGRSGDGMNGYLFHFWNKEWLRVDRPYNEVVTDLFTASAKSSATIAAANLMSRNSFDTNVLPMNAGRLPRGEPSRCDRRFQHRNSPNLPRYQHDVHLLSRRRRTSRTHQ